MKLIVFTRFIFEGRCLALEDRPSDPGMGPPGLKLALANPELIFRSLQTECWQLKVAVLDSLDRKWNPSQEQGGVKLHPFHSLWLHHWPLDLLLVYQNTLNCSHLLQNVCLTLRTPTGYR